MHTKKTDEADERPFYMYIVIPKDSEEVTVQKGLLFFQNVGPYGIKTLTTDYLRNYFSDKYHLALKIFTVAPQLFIEKVLKKEAIKKIIMVKNHKSFDFADNMNNVGYGVETRTIAKLHFQNTTWSRIMDALRYSIKGQTSYFEFEQKRYDGLKVIVNIGGRDRTIDIHNINNLSIIESIPDEIQGIDGLPNKARLLAYFQKVTDEYLSKMVLQIK